MTRPRSNPYDQKLAPGDIVTVAKPQYLGLDWKDDNFKIADRSTTTAWRWRRLCTTPHSYITFQAGRGRSRRQDRPVPQWQKVCPDRFRFDHRPGAGVSGKEVRRKAFSTASLGMGVAKISIRGRGMKDFKIFLTQFTQKRSLNASSVVSSKLTGTEPAT